MTATYKYEPESTIHPGYILEEHLEARQMSQAEFAQRCDRSPKLISDIIAGQAAIDQNTALRFQETLGMDARIWLGIEDDYRRYLEREAETRRMEEAVEWARRFPINELVKRGYIERPASNKDRAPTLLSFFGVASVEAWRGQYVNPSVAYRHSPSFDSDDHALATWLRLGEIMAERAERAECPPYDRENFVVALTRIRQLTAKSLTERMREARIQCFQSGVVLVVIKPLPKTSLSGVSRLLPSGRALIQLSARHMSDDQLWFSLFHEAAHILLHDQAGIFVHASKGDTKITKFDDEADEWASNFLIPQDAWRDFSASLNFGPNYIKRFAEAQGIAPGIVVGRLQHEGKLAWGSRLNRLKARIR